VILCHVPRRQILSPGLGCTCTLARDLNGNHASVSLTFPHKHFTPALSLGCNFLRALIVGSWSLEIYCSQIEIYVSMLLGPQHGLVFVIKWPTPMRCLPQVVPTASHEYLCCLLRGPMLPPTSTRCRPRPPRLAALLKKVPEILWCGLLYHSPIPFPATTLCLSI
jgi:hypothetical protein